MLMILLGPNEFVTPPAPQPQLACTFAEGPLGLRMVCLPDTRCVAQVQSGFEADPPRRVCLALSP